jgi:hypothetical protein
MMIVEDIPIWDILFSFGDLTSRKVPTYNEYEFD